MPFCGRIMRTNTEEWPSKSIMSSILISCLRWCTLTNGLCFDANRLHDQPEALDGYLRPLVIKLIKQKSPGWSYEREYRVFIDLPSCEISRGNYFRPIPDDYLKRVILGFKCPLETSYVMQSLA